MGIKITDGLLPPAPEDDTIFLHLYASLRRYCRSGVGSAGADFYFIALLHQVYSLKTLNRNYR